MADANAREKILSLIKCKPHGFTLRDISEAAVLNRLTCTKYLGIMEAEGLLEHKNVGMAKLWFAKQRPTLLNCLQGEYSVKELLVDEKTDEIRSPAGLINALVPQDVVSALYFEFRDIDGFETRLFNVGRNVSVKRAKDYYLKTLNVQPAHHLVHADKIINVIRYYCKSGWGKIKAVDVKRAQVKITLEQSFEANSVLSHKHGPIRKPICNIMRGRIAGLFEGFCGIEYDAKETRCKAMGDKVCEFVVRPRYLK